METGAELDWRFALVDDSNRDSLQCATEDLSQLQTELKTKSAKSVANILGSGNVTPVANHRHTVRWVHRVGNWIDPTPGHTATDRLVNWILGTRNQASSAVERIAVAIQRLEECRKLVPIEPLESRIELAQKLAWFQLLIKYHPPLQFADVLDFPEEFPLDPWSQYRKWQYFSDGSYLSHWNATQRLKFPYPTRSACKRPI